MPNPDRVGRAGWLLPLGLCLGLVLITLAVFAQTGEFEFLNFDDDLMISDNRQLQAGLSMEGVRWAFAANLLYHDRGVEYWQPLTALTRLADVEFYGFDAGRHHLTSVMIHIAAGLVLFGAMTALLRSSVRAAIIAAFFLIHPLHVEPVAWLSARKDLVNGLFYFATVWAYAWYAARRNSHRYAVVCVSFLCASMAKPMAISLPLVLLLLDYWPLGRIGLQRDYRRAFALLIEKVPFLLIAAGVSVLAIVGQHRHGAMGDASMYPLAVRLGNAATAFCVYLGQTFVPVRLSVFYPHPGVALDWSLALLSAGCCAAITALCVLQARARPWLLVGWGWYVIVLLPVSGIVQIGEMSRADRYTYVALVGIFVLIVQQGAEFLRPRGTTRHDSLAVRTAVALSVCAVIGAAAFLAWKQTATWQNSISVFAHAIAVTDDNYVAHANLGSALFAAGRREEGLKHYDEAVRLHQPAIKHHREAAAEAEKRGDVKRAARHYGKILTVVPSDAEVRQLLGELHYRSGDYAKALAQFNEALRHNREAVPPRVAIARVLIAQSRTDEARALLAAVLQTDPANVEAAELLKQLTQ